jgi:NADH-quinone oxidoreductase subunit J
MDFKTISFYLFAAILVFAAVRVITARNPVHAALFLVLSFFSAAGLWVLLRAEFLAISLVLVYVGAVMVLFLFVVMMLDIDMDKMRQGFWSFLPVGGLVGALMVLIMGFVLMGGAFDKTAPAAPAAGYSNTKELGRLIYTEYAYPFELAAVILTVAIVAAIALTLRGRKDSKYADPSKQVLVKREDRLKLVKMKAEEKQ